MQASVNQPTAGAPDVSFLRLNEVLKRVPVSKSTWWDGIRKGKYPAGVKLSHRCTAWSTEAIDELVKKIMIGDC